MDLEQKLALAKKALQQAHLALLRAHAKDSVAGRRYHTDLAETELALALDELNKPACLDCGEPVDVKHGAHCPCRQEGIPDEG